MATESTRRIESDSSDESTIAETTDLDDIPDQEDIEAIGDFALHDSTGRITPFRSVFTRPNSPRRVLVIFVGHLLSPVRPLA
jgi:hypothetical protein